MSIPPNHLPQTPANYEVVSESRHGTQYKREIEINGKRYEAKVFVSKDLNLKGGALEEHLVVTVGKMQEAWKALEGTHTFDKLTLHDNNERIQTHHKGVKIRDMMLSELPRVVETARRVSTAAEEAFRSEALPLQRDFPVHPESFSSDPDKGRLPPGRFEVRTIPAPLLEASSPPPLEASLPQGRIRNMADRVKNFLGRRPNREGEPWASLSPLEPASPSGTTTPSSSRSTTPPLSSREDEEARSPAPRGDEDDFSSSSSLEDKTTPPRVPTRGDEEASSPSPSLEDEAAPPPVPPRGDEEASSSSPSLEDEAAPPPPPPPRGPATDNRLHNRENKEKLSQGQKATTPLAEQVEEAKVKLRTASQTSLTSKDSESEKNAREESIRDIFSKAMDARRPFIEEDHEETDEGANSESDWVD